MQAFIIRPFGRKQDVDFDRVERELIQPALREAEIVGGTTGTILEAGNIREDMFQLLLLADVVVADISIHNANVFYELGIRHSLRGRQTYLIRSRVVKSKEERTALDEVPFDLKTDRYLEYDAVEPGASVAELVRGLKETKVSNRVDSPVFRSLPHLEEPQRNLLSPVPLGFANDLDLAASCCQGGKMGLLGWEAGRFVWEMGGRRLVGRQQFHADFLAGARRTWETIQSVYPLDLEANLLLGTIYQRLGELVRSDQCLQNVLANPQAGIDDRTEALTLLGRNAKTQGGAALLVEADAAKNGIAVLRAGLFLRSRDLLTQAFQQNLNHFYSGLNALSLTLLLLDLIELHRTAWEDMFETDAAALAKEDALKHNAAGLTAGVELSLAGAQQRAEAKDAIWLAISRADYLFLTARRDGVAGAAYLQALSGAQPFHVTAARKQLELFASLGARAERVKLCLEGFPAGEQASSVPLQQAIVFTGHRVDGPDRKSPRFPNASVARARTMIREAVMQQRATAPGSTLGLAGAANGGDILFHEICAELGIATRVLLTLPRQPYIDASVADGGAEWIARFHTLMDHHAANNEVQVLDATRALPGWMRDPPGYDVWQRTNLWLLEEAIAAGAQAASVIALWDGESGDGPGGTSDMLDAARKREMRVIVVDAKQLIV